MKATLKDIADITGLSISTVSRILRGESKTSSKNVELAIKTAQEINYPLNSRVLNDRYNFKKRLQVALITSFEPDEFYSTFFYGFYEATRNENITLSLFVYNEDESTLAEFITDLSYNSIDAAILFLPELHEEDYEGLLPNCPDDFTFISVAPLFNPILDTVTFDAYRGGYLIAKHFYERGYYEVGMITGPPNKNESLLRRNGFMDFISQKKDMKLVWECEGDYSFNSGKEAFFCFQKEEHKPRAIFALNDYMGLGFMEQSMIHNVKIPDDVAIAGYDDLPLTSRIHPSLTSVHCDYTTLGKTSFQILKEKMETGGPHSGLLSNIPVSLSIRESS
tara:strand:+ start:259891 stop:260895 length:1005 start_codon:yes stop_codon:yes gene_type:complete